MARLLYIKANPKPCDQSLTYRLSDFFIQAYQQAHPTDEVGGEIYGASFIY